MFLLISVLPFNGRLIRMESLQLLAVRIANTYRKPHFDEEDATSGFLLIDCIFPKGIRLMSVFSQEPSKLSSAQVPRIRYVSNHFINDLYICRITGKYSELHIWHACASYPFQWQHFLHILLYELTSGTVEVGNSAHLRRG